MFLYAQTGKTDGLAKLEQKRAYEKVAKKCFQYDLIHES